MKRKKDEAFLHWIGRDIGKEAARQIRGFPGEFRGQVTGGWGNEFARQIFGSPRRRRRGNR
jgi:hypothetical protein